MFIAYLQDGTKLVESDTKTAPEGIRYVPNWAAVPKDIRIVGISLTDGLHIIETLAGFDEYLVLQEAVAGVRAVANSKGEISFIQGIEPSVVAQRLYGIRDIKPIKNEINLAATDIRDEWHKAFEPEIQKTVGQNVRIIQGYKLGDAKISEKVKTLFDNLIDKEVAWVEVRVNRGFTRITEFKEDKKGLRRGVPKLNGYNRDFFKQQLSLEAKKDGG